MASKTQRRLYLFSFHRTPLLMSRRNPGLPQRISSNRKIFLGQTQCLQKDKPLTTLSIKDSSFCSVLLRGPVQCALLVMQSPGLGLAPGVQMAGSGWPQAAVTQIPVATRTIISVRYQLRTAHWIFLCYLILSIPGPDPIKIPSSIYITEIHPNPNKSLFAGLTSPDCYRTLHSLQVGSLFGLPGFPVTFKLKLSLLNSHLDSQNSVHLMEINVSHPESDGFHQELKTKTS